MAIIKTKRQIQPDWPLRFDQSMGPYASVDSVAASLKQDFIILLQTIPGEWPMRPDLGVGLVTYTFETMDSKNSKDVQAKTSIYKFAQKQNKRLLVLHGPPGTGKSHGLKAIVNYKAKKGETGIYMMYSKYSVIVANFQKENHKDISLIEQMMKTKYLIIDDVEPVYENNPIPKQKFEQILIVRFDHNLTTAINTNLDLNSFSSPVVSRFLDEKNTLLINYSMVKDKRS